MYAIAVIAAVVAIGIGYLWYNSVIRDIVRTPLQTAKITDMTSLQNQQDLNRFWGTYRSGMYFGMKTRSPRSPVVGRYFTVLVGLYVKYFCSICDMVV